MVSVRVAKVANQPAMTALKAFQDVRQLLAHGLRIELQDAMYDVAHPSHVRRVQVSRVGARPEVAHHHSRWVGTEMEGLTIHQCGLRQGIPRWGMSCEAVTAPAASCSGYFARSPLWWPS